jgi:sec-independent protein translocase protein TatB
VFENLNWWEIGALLVIALLIFGDKLPNVINDGLRMLRNLRTMANNATSDLSRELGTDIQLTDLHPKTFIRKHLLSEEDEATIRRPLDGLQRDLSDVARTIDPRAVDPRAAATRPSTLGPTPKPTPAPTPEPVVTPVSGAADEPAGETAPEPLRTRFDLDAT